MRYGLIADVHANLHALEAVLAALSGTGVDRWVCAGDVVGYGPRPNECVSRVAELSPALVVVAGNHDLMAVGRLGADGLGPLQARTLRWTREVLGADARAFLEGLPTRASTDEGVVVAHGSLDDPSEYVWDCAAAAAQLARVPEATALVLGHTHRPLSCGRVFNPGSVGQPRERRAVARAMVLDVDVDAGRAERVAVSYDAAATRAELGAAGLPPGACHLKPSIRASVARRLARRG
jgi:putative phosphoesterase